MDFPPDRGRNISDFSLHASRVYEKRTWLCGRSAGQILPSLYSACLSFHQDPEDRQGASVRFRAYLPGCVPDSADLFRDPVRIYARVVKEV